MLLTLTGALEHKIPCWFKGESDCLATKELSISLWVSVVLLRSAGDLVPEGAQELMDIKSDLPILF